MSHETPQPSHHDPEPGNRARGREPILNGPPPWGVGVFGLAILLVHLLVPLGSDPAGIRLAADLAFIPARVTGADGAPPYGGVLEILRALVTHQFLHAGWIHLMMNTLMLISVGPVAERGLGAGAAGAGRFLAFILACGIGGAFGFWLVNPDLVGFMMGASGGLSGVFAGYIWLALARSRHDPRLRRAAFEAGVVFLVLNVGLAAAARFGGVVPIAWESHLFGFLTGLVLYPLFAGLSWREALWTITGRAP
jgi:membrane associated rhomboid family serine protease